MARKALTNINIQAEDALKHRIKAKHDKEGQIYVDGETLEPIIFHPLTLKRRKTFLNPNIERRRVIHLHAETHQLDDPDYRVIATNDVEDMFKMKDFNEATDQHYVCKRSAAVDGCTEVFSIHQETNNSEIKCNICDATFTKTSNLKKHLLNKHNK